MVRGPSDVIAGLIQLYVYDQLPRVLPRSPGARKRVRQLGALCDVTPAGNGHRGGGIVVLDRNGARIQ